MKILHFSAIAHRLLITTAIGVALPAYAQTASSPGQADATVAPQGDAISEIVVTATKRAERLKDVPMAVDVATGEQIEKYKIFDVKDVSQLAPGLQLSNSNGRQNVASIRGVTFNPDTGGPASVAVYLNEIPVDIQTATTALYDVAQIEVLRGPQGTLRGRTAPAGAITITTRSPDLRAIDGYIQGTLTTRAGRNLQGGISVPLIEDKLAVRVSGLLDHNRLNHVYDINRDEYSSSRTTSGRVAVAFAPTERISGNLIYQYLDSRTDLLRQVFGPGAQPSPLSPYRTGSTIRRSDRLAVQEGQSPNTNKTHFVVGNASVDLDSHTLSFLGGYQDTKALSILDLDIGNIIAGYSPRQYTPVAQTSTTLESRVTSNWSGPVNYIFGIFYNRTTNKSPTSVDLNTFFNAGGVPLPPTTRLPLLANVNIKNNSSDLAFFGDVRARITDKLKIDIGARYTRNAGNAQSFLTVSSPGLPAFGIPPFVNPNNQPTVAPEFVKRVFHPLTGTASISYDFTRDVTGYVTYGRSYRRGTAQLGVNTPLDSSLLVLNPERSNAVEVGVKSNLFDRKLSVNIAAFYQKFDGYIDITLVNPSPNRDGVVNSSGTNVSYNGDASTRGVELQLDARPSRNWDIGLNASYADAHWDGASVPCNDYNGDGKPDSIGTPRVPLGQQVSFCVRNDRLGDISKFAMNITSEVRMEVGSLTPFLRGLYTFRPAFTSGPSSYRFPDVSNLNLFFGIRSGGSRWELSGFVRNVFNTVQVQSVAGDQFKYSTSGGALPPPLLSGYRQIAIAPPREFGITASMNF